MLDFSSLTPLEGGWSGQTFLARAGADQSVVRLYPPTSRGGVGPQVDAAVLRLVRGLVPVPSVLEVHHGDADLDRPGVLVTAWVEGERGDLLLPTLDADDRATLGGVLGAVLADLGGMPMLRPGVFVDADLDVEPFDHDLPAYVDLFAAALGHLTDDERAGLDDIALEAQTLLDEAGRVCLVHGDFNPKNLLVDPSGLRLTALIDWEFAHAGHPATDLGNLLRFERDQAFTEGVLTSYIARRGGEPSSVLACARAADLFALVELTSRRGQNPVADRADELLRAIARERDLSATPAPV